MYIVVQKVLTKEKGGWKKKYLENISITKTSFRKIYNPLDINLHHDALMEYCEEQKLG